MIKLLADIVFILESTKTDINLLEGSDLVKKNILDKYEKTIKGDHRVTYGQRMT